jgi:polar amino acid transport system substrate-binding protein
LKKHLTLIALLFVLLIGALPLLTACTASTHVVSATVYGSGHEDYSQAAQAADQAIEELTKSPDIAAPATIEAGKLIVASDAAYPPLEYSARIVTKEGDEDKQSDPTTVGFEIDLCRAIAKKLGLEPQFLTVGFRYIPETLIDGKADLAAAGMITSPGLLTQLVASDTYLSADLAICSKTGVDLADSAALQGKIVAVQMGSTAEAAVAAIEGVAETRPYSHVLGAFDDLAAGKVDAVVVVARVAKWVLDNDSEYADSLQISGTIETGEGFAFWFAKGDEELAAAVNAALLELQQAPSVAAAPTTTVAVTVTAADATTTTVQQTDTTSQQTTTTTVAGKSVYQLLLEKWGLTED